MSRASPLDRFERWHVRESVLEDPDDAGDLLRCARQGGEIVAAAAAGRRLRGRGLEVGRLEPGGRADFEGYMAERWSWGWGVEAARALRRDPVTCHVARRGGRVVGFAAHSVSGPGQFGPMGTDADLR